jgi:hypothetical protein
LKCRQGQLPPYTGVGKKVVRFKKKFNELICGAYQRYAEPCYKVVSPSSGSVTYKKATPQKRVGF